MRLPLSPPPSILSPLSAPSPSCLSPVSLTPLPMTPPATFVRATLTVSPTITSGRTFPAPALSPPSPPTPPPPPASPPPPPPSQPLKKGLNPMAMPFQAKTAATQLRPEASSWKPPGLVPSEVQTPVSAVMMGKEGWNHSPMQWIS
eukprot:Sspe_Gene.108580::Locus_87715_Transcript_1_1_Confidence_1.000_Length_438::g.108580::m.108580